MSQGETVAPGSAGVVPLSLDEANHILRRARAAADGLGLAVTVAVVDAAGHLVAMNRMDGASWISVDTAFGKAFTAAAYAEPSAAQGEKARSLPQFAAALSAMTDGRYLPQIGGLPVLRKGHCVGAVGASGATGQQDEAIVREALEAFGETV